MAVVVALAMVAIFGAMSLANPAFADHPDGTRATPASTDSVLCLGADDVSVPGPISDQGVGVGGTERYDIAACFSAEHDTAIATVVTGVESSDTSIVTVAFVNTPADGSDPRPTAAETAARHTIDVTGVKVGTAEVKVFHRVGGTRTFDVTVYDSGPTIKATIPAQSLQQGTTNTVNVDLSDYFGGEDLEITATSSATLKIPHPTPTGNMLALMPTDEEATGNARITVIVKNPADDTGVTQSFTAYLDDAPGMITVGEVDNVSVGDGTAGTPYELVVLPVKAGEDLQVDLLDLFSGARLLVVVESDDEDAATVSVSNGLVTVSGVAIGDPKTLNRSHKSRRNQVFNCDC